MDENQSNTQYQYTYYQNLYNSFGGYKPEIDLRAGEIRRMGMLAGGAMIGFTVMQYVIMYVLNFLGLYDLFVKDAVFQMGISCIIPLFYVVLPFTVLYVIYKPDERKKVEIFDKPKSKELFLYATFAGLMICSVGDRITSVLQAVFNSTGLEFSENELLEPNDALSGILYFIACAVVPALVEEFAFRGILMQPLRKYGDKFAIVMSSIIFALAHGNMVQIPFAFIAGLALGYFQIATGSIWTGVAIHFLNNGIATVISIYYQTYPNASNLFFIVVEGAITVIGIVAIILFLCNKKYKLVNDKNEFKGGVKFASFLCTPTVVISIIIALNSTLGYTQINSSSGVTSLVVANIVLSVLVIVGAVKLHGDTRIKYSGMYTFSAVLMCLTAVIGSFALMLSMLTGGING